MSWLPQPSNERITSSPMSTAVKRLFEQKMSNRWSSSSWVSSGFLERLAPACVPSTRSLPDLIGRHLDEGAVPHPGPDLRLQAHTSTASADTSARRCAGDAPCSGRRALDPWRSTATPRATVPAAYRSPRGVSRQAAKNVQDCSRSCEVRREAVRSDGSRGSRRWSRRRESNPRPAAYKAAALPTELRRPCVKSTAAA